MPKLNSFSDTVESVTSTSFPKIIKRNRQPSISGSSLARSFVYSSFKPNLSSPNNDLLQVHTSDSIHENTADYADIAIPYVDEESDDYTTFSPNRSTSEQSQIQIPTINENTPLQAYDEGNNCNTYDAIFTDLEALKETTETFSYKDVIRFFRDNDSSTLIEECCIKPFKYIPSVFLGTLLNVLDALSYGMIIFPIGEAVFSGMGPSGLSMFYVSTVLSQLIFSLGGSAFKSGIGSEMIEITPFFHQMAINIMLRLSNDSKTADDPNLNKMILSTTIFTFAISSIVTGLCFGILGKCKLGKLVGFFPRHILVGCIGGVGYFLVITGIEVSSRIEGGIEYNLSTLRYLIDPLPFLQWTIPLILAIVLIVIQKLNSNPLIVPSFLMLVFILFHVLIMIVPSWNLTLAREYGWVFQAESSNEPWYSFYQYYDFQLCDWWLVLNQLPTMLALTFFGILHVPINVPALALTVGMDTYDVDRELIAHGISNFVSGLCGSIQNYLVYTNSVLFIRSGADSRLSGVLLAVATCCIMMIGPVLIGFIPVSVVGLLIYLLGYELLKESVWDTIGRLRTFEYATIIIIVITMGAWDFVYGILVGILLACVSFVIEAGSKPVISEVYTGEYAKSIVVRHPKQSEFLKNVGKQICVMKLSGSLFFGSIGGLEDNIRAMFELANYRKQPIKYLILDLKDVLTFDFSATEGFKRIRNLLMDKDCIFIISSIDDNKSGIVESLKFCGLWETIEHENKIQMFTTLNSALEWCENIFLQNYKDLITAPRNMKSIGKNLSISERSSPIIGTPRHIQFMDAARKHNQNEQYDKELILSKIIDDDRKVSGSHMKQPLYLILQTMQGLSDKTDDKFWIPLISYLSRVQYKPGESVYDKTMNKPTLFFIESGLVDFKIEFNDLRFSINSSEMPLTMFGDIATINSNRTIKYSANNNCVLWQLDHSRIEKLKNEESEIYEELLLVYLRITTQRYESITSNVLIS